MSKFVTSVLGLLFLISVMEVSSVVADEYICHKNIVKLAMVSAQHPYLRIFVPPILKSSVIVTPELFTP